MELSLSHPLTGIEPRPRTARRAPSARALAPVVSTPAPPPDDERLLPISREPEMNGRTRLLIPQDVRIELLKPTVGPALELRRRSEIATRAVNILLATVALIIAAPVMLLVAVAVWLTSPGPVFYTQVRVGQDRRGLRRGIPAERRQSDHGGRLFTMYKFRSMRVDAEADGRAVWARPNDSRVTPIGRLLRATRLDELPLLFNVLLGDMNIVGPRPERPCIFAQLRENIAEYPMRQLAQPGITGWAQINHTYDSSVDDVRIKVRYDLEYLSRQSLWTDFVIMLRTVPVMFRKSGW
jgi:lipopolysaccharide/colanic/teichoic acid biosynthesis glycosyltransferase